MSIPVGTYEGIMRTMLRFKGGTSHQQQIYEAMKDRPLYASPPTATTLPALPPENPQPLEQVKIRKW